MIGNVDFSRDAAVIVTPLPASLCHGYYCAGMALAPPLFEGYRRYAEGCEEGDTQVLLLRYLLGWPARYLIHGVAYIRYAREVIYAVDTSVQGYGFATPLLLKTYAIAFRCAKACFRVAMHHTYITKRARHHQCRTIARFHVAFLIFEDTGYAAAKH